MDDYPRAFVARARPLVVFSGLPEGEEDASIPATLQNGTVIETRGPGLDGPYGVSLRDKLLSFNVSDTSINERDVRTLNLLQLRIRTAGKVCIRPNLAPIIH